MNEIKVNEIPSLTWNWMKMNRDCVAVEENYTEEKIQCEKLPSGISFGEKFEINMMEAGSGICNKSNPKLNAEKTAGDSEKEAEEALQAVKNHAVNRLLSAAVSEPQTIVLSGKISEPALFSLCGKGNTASVQKILAKKDCEATLIFLYEGDKTSQIIRTEVYAEEGAKVHIVKVQLLNENAVQLDDTGITVMDGAKVSFTQIELGGKHIASGLHVNLQGYRSAFESNVAYICQKNQQLDMNHIVYHFGAKSECNMKVNGTLKDEAVKTYRGTIDFKKGCAASVGHEIEETLLLNPKVVNKSLPVILCDEEDVEGTHGASIGRLSNDILFYMQTRGISREAAEHIMSRAKVQATADLIPDENVKAKISEYIAE